MEINSKSVNQNYCEYNLGEARKHLSPRDPAPHQSSALQKLSLWFKGKNTSYAGGILALPTGAGKTFTAMRFLCTGPLSQGYKVFWLAHTHHLLDQAFESLAKEVGHILEPKSKLNVRVVSGAPGYCHPADIKSTDDVVICTLQTLVTARRTQHPQLTKFLQTAGNKLFVVFDEAHHAPAHSYRTLIQGLREEHPGMSLLGLTATPTYTDEKKRGWLNQLFPQDLLYQATTQQLLPAGILAQPAFEDHNTNFTAEFDTREYQKWLGTYRDLPENVITELAQSQERNLYIAQTYYEARERYGKTIIFADRWFQCDQLRGFLRSMGVRADSVYSHVDADAGSPEARNSRTEDENKRILEDFRQNKLDVLINVRMLTEGTDVPDVNTVFLTRQTTSKILLTQMIGRALRGPKFGGTDKAYIVAFIDKWKELINWAEYDNLAAEGLAESGPAAGMRAPLHLISIDRVRDLIDKMDQGRVIETEPFLTLLPLGWYHVEFVSLIKDSEDLETVQQVVMVFEHEQDNYRRFIEALLQTNLDEFADENVLFDDRHEQLITWQAQFFMGDDTHIGSDLLINLFHIARHIAQNEQAPRFFSFEERKNHDLDAVAQQFLADKLDRIQEHASLQVEYHRLDRYWSVIYPNITLFKSQYNACMERLLTVGAALPQDYSLVFTNPELRSDREPSDEVKRQVKERDGNHCLSCGEDYKRLLQIDHVAVILVEVMRSATFKPSAEFVITTKASTRSISALTAPHCSSNQHPFPRWIYPAREASNLVDWEKFLRRSINFFYRCAAVRAFTPGRQGQWRIELYAGNDPAWLEPYLEDLVQSIRQRRVELKQQGPRALIVSAPDLPVVSYSVESQ